MNLIHDAWIPVKRASGGKDWISPLQITEPDIVALDASRADFNGALIQFLIGLLQTTTPVDSQSEWSQWFKRPPTAEVLCEWFAKVTDAFELDGDGPRFMQDFTLRTKEAPDKDFNNISALLIDAPGDNTLKENKDHFIKRDSVVSLCPCCAATALFCLQTNAPSGGNGHFTSIRGGGPLTTLIVPATEHSLWQVLWLNIREQSQFLAGCGNAELTNLHLQFPWLGDISLIQVLGGRTAPVQVHPAQIYWAMPRRIRLGFDNLASGSCSVCARETDRLIRRYLTKAKGFNYKGEWNHPLSPYYENKPGEYLPVHPGPDGFGYKHWLGWVLGLQSKKRGVRPATNVAHTLESRRLRGQQIRLWVFGYDMDNMKARCWYESTLPLYELADCDKGALDDIQSVVSQCLEGADLAAYFLRSAVKSAWFSEGVDVKGDWSFIDTKFWSGTEPVFYRLLQEIISIACSGEEEPDLNPVRDRWRSALIQTAKSLFDADLVGAAPIERQNPHRVAEAYNKLKAGLDGDKLKLALGIPFVKKNKKQAKKSA